MIFIGGLALAIYLWNRDVGKLNRSRPAYRFVGDSDALLRTIESIIPNVRGRVIARDSQSITFKTGMSWYTWSGQTVRIFFRPAGDTLTDIAIGTLANPSFQIADWREGERIRIKVFDLIARDHSRLDEPPPAWS